VGSAAQAMKMPQSSAGREINFIKFIAVARFVL
jgi:hypothetical protein